MGDVHSFQYVNGLKHTKFTVESPITCIDIGTYQNNEKQRIIVCHNFNISGFTPKGKQIFEHHSNIQGHVDSMCVNELKQIIVACFFSSNCLDLYNLLIFIIL
ncbi:hypothetical protein Smp_197740 [Schistosoma mansoni]|uniref:hypothetical protein n=1 Tax=Schistosoma mansoni TaxID=6183 RepID=UPI00022C87BB|nr:hypothetical protein Smp_197740 [Schistosoma mansoni]|eukprot:XP_018645547.1 hypothetical protein Smp_197740 [Schistosoma mansoni]